MGATVLVVEDEPQIQELVAVNLEHSGHEVLRASSAEEAEAAIRVALPDVLVLDWMLPGESGLSLARRLRAGARTRDLPILMLTARAMEQDKISGLEAGADDYLTKPFSPKELAARIKAVLRRRARRGIRPARRLSPVYRSTLVSLAGLAAVAAIAWTAVGAASGLSVFAAGLLALLVYHVRHLARFGRWVSHPVQGKVPEGAGSWDEVLAALHRFEREAAKREEMLADALARFRRAAQALPDGVVMLDADNRIEWCNDNAAAMLNLDPRADTGRPIANLAREPAFIDYLAAPNHDSMPAARATAAQGVVLALQLIPYGDSQKLLLCRDVTQFAKVETMRRDFVANVSHELRTPLTVLVGFLETVRELKLDAERSRDYFKLMSEQGKRMQSIIEDLLTLSALESAPEPPRDERV